MTALAPNRREPARTPRTRGLGAFALLAALLVASVLLSLSIGSYPVPVASILHFAAAKFGLAAPPGHAAVLENVLIDIRLPRVIAAVLIGTALSGSGTAMQAVFRNPLVSPGMLGVLAGASLAMLLGRSGLDIQVLAFGFGLLAVGVAIAIAGLFGRGSVVTLLLGGIISSAMFGALLSLVKYLADPQDRLPSITYWLMGSLANVRLAQLGWAAWPMGVVVVALALLGRPLDAISMGDDDARALGVPVTAVRYGVIGLATLASALAVSLAGMIGWVGLIAPHIARLMLGPGNTRLMPGSLLFGASFLVLADCLARSLSSIEIPIGIVTECLGLPVFLLVLYRARRAWD